MPDVLLQETSPYGTRRASVLRGEGDVYLYLEDVVGDVETQSAVWVANLVPAPRGDDPPADDGTTDPGAPPRMGAGGTRHPEGCPELDPRLDLVWFEEGDAVALVDSEGVLAVIPGWAGHGGFYGYSRYARGQSALAWELTREAREAFEAKVTESREFWSWRATEAWPQIRSTGLAHLEARIGPQEAAWPVGEALFPELIASRHRFGSRDIWVTATTGLSAQRMPGVEQFHEDPDRAARVELAIARATPDQAAVDLLGALALVPFGRCTWLGEGHTVGGTPGSHPEFGADKASILLTARPPYQPDLVPPDLSGLERRGAPVTYLWVMLIDEETFRIARGRDARNALQHLYENGRTWVQ